MSKKGMLGMTIVGPVPFRGGCVWVRAQLTAEGMILNGLLAGMSYYADLTERGNFTTVYLGIEEEHIEQMVASQNWSEEEVAELWEAALECPAE